MAEIQEYLPESQAQQPVGGVSPNIELAGSVGRSIERFGQGVESIGDDIYKRQAQEESADAYASTSDMRLRYFQRAQQGIQDGSLDTEQLKQDFDDESSKVGENFVTAVGKNAFVRQQARVKGSVLKYASMGMTQVAANKALGLEQRSIDTNVNLIEQYPGEYGDINDSYAEHINDHASADGSGVVAKNKDKLLLNAQTQYAQAAVRGTAQQFGTKAAMDLLNGPLGNNLDFEKRRASERDIDEIGRRKEIESDRTDRAVERHIKASELKWGADNFEKLQNGALTTADVEKAVKDRAIRPEMGEHYIKAIRDGNDRALETNPEDYKALAERITDPNARNPIRSFQDLLPYVHDHKLAIEGKHSLATLKKLIDETPQGVARKTGQDQLFNLAKASILYPDIQTNKGNDSFSVAKLNDFYSDYAQKKSDVAASGGNPDDLLDKKSPLYFGNNLSKYKIPVSERFRLHAMDRINKTNDPNEKTGPPQAQGTPPGASPTNPPILTPPAQPPPTKPNPNARLRGADGKMESGEAWAKRTHGGTL